MNKLTLISMAVLCLLMCSCSQHEIESNPSSDVELLSRSSQPTAVNPIAVTYVTQEGVNASQQCTRATIVYASAGAAQLVFTFSDSTTVAVVGDNISLAVEAGSELEVTTAASIFNSADLSIEQCEETLCYNNSAATNSGTALEFIVEDELAGM